MPTKQKSLTYGLSKVIEAPLPFVYEWCTDFREDDAELTGSKNKEKILEKTKSRVIMASPSDVSVITLMPPDAWHLDTAGSPKEQEVGDYKLTKMGPNKTRLDMVFDVKFGDGVEVPSKENAEDGSGKFWDKLIVALMKDYSKEK